MKLPRVQGTVLAVVCMVACLLAQDNPYATPGNNAPLSSNISLVIDVEASTYSGQVDIVLIGFFPTKLVVLNWVGPTISVDQVQFKTVLDREISVVSVTSDPDHEQITIEVAEELKDGNLYNCSIQFSKPLGSSPADGLYKYSYLDNTNVARLAVKSNLQYVNARRVFPCYDEPELSLRLKLTVIHPSQYTALSTAPIVSTSPHVTKPGWVVTEFNDTDSMSTYKLGIVLAEMVESAEVTVSNTGRLCDAKNISLAVWTRDMDPTSVNFTLQTTIAVLVTLEHLILDNFPLMKLDIVASYDTSVEPLGAQDCGIIQLRDDTISDAETGRLDRLENAWILANALAGQWIGCLVTVKWWTSLWGFEGVRNELAGLVLDQVFPTWDIHNIKRAESLDIVFRYDCLNSSKSISTSLDDPRDISNIFGKKEAAKGFALGHMVSRVLGSLYGQALDFFMQSFNFGVSEVADTYQFVMKMTEHQDILPDNITMPQIMSTWSDQPGYPVLSVQRNVGSLTITQKRFLLSGEEASGKECWWIPVTHATAKAPIFNQSVVSESWWNGCNQSTLVLQTNAGNDDWIIIINRALVVCHVNYDSHTWSLLLTLLTTGDVTQLDEINRYQLVKDVFALAHAGQVEYSLAFQVLKYLKREPRLVPWLAGIQTLTSLEKFVWRSPLYAQFKTFVRSLVEDLYKANSDLTAVTASVEEWRYRVTLAQVACDAQVQSCVSSAVASFKQWMSSGNTAASLDPDVRRLVYCEGVRQGKQAEFDFVWGKYQSSTSDREQRILLDALACTPQQDLLDRLLNKILDQSSGLKIHHAFDTFRFVAQNSPLGFNSTVKFLDENFEKIYNLKRTIVDYVSLVLEKMIFSSEIEQVKAQTLAHKEMLSHFEAVVNQSLAVAEVNRLWITKYLNQMPTLLA